MKIVSMTFPSGEFEVRQALADLDIALSSQGMCAEDEGAVQLVLGEVLNNIVEHAYGPDCDGEIELHCWPGECALAFRVIDGGRPLPGLRLPEGKPVNLGCALEDLPEGGFGWLLVRQLTSALAYRREADRNELCFLIPLSQFAGQDCPESTE